MSSFTPLHIEILLWHRTRGALMPNHEAPAVVDYRNELIRDEILWADIANPSGYSLTRKGDVWLEAILSTPYPVLQYINVGRSS